MRLRTPALYALAAVYVSAALSGCSANTTPGLPQTANLSQAASNALRSNDIPVEPFKAPNRYFPGQSYTGPTGIRKHLISATIALNSGKTVGGMYYRDTGKWVQLRFPKAESTAAYGPESIPNGFRVVGSYKNKKQQGDSGFVYDSVSNQYTPIVASPDLCAPESCNYTIAHSVFQNGAGYLVVGNYDAALQPPTGVEGHAFLYDSANGTLSTIDVPGSISTTAYGIWIDGKTVAVAGGYADTNGQHAYVRDLTGQHFLSYDYPNARITHFEGISGAGGAGNYDVVGDYNQRHGKGTYGFYQQIRNWKACQPIVIGKLSANSVDRRTVVGIYGVDGGP
jgi:hypothetical protein